MEEDDDIKSHMNKFNKYIFELLGINVKIDDKVQVMKLIACSKEYVDNRRGINNIFEN